MPLQEGDLPRGRRRRQHSGSFRKRLPPTHCRHQDTIATGTDVKPLEVLLFMRDVRSKGYYEQMKGRCAAWTATSLRVSNSADGAKPTLC